MFIFKLTVLSTVVLLLAGCTNTGWHNGLMYAFHDVKEIEDNTWYLKLVGGFTHDQEDLKLIVRKKAQDICGNASFEISDENPGVTNHHTGMVEVNYPTLITYVKCT